MTREEKYIARIMLKNKFFECDKQQYENLFVQVMGLGSTTFKGVKPQGSYGDRKNDGFDKANGSYYQVYAPEDLQGNEDKTIKKLKEDFEGLKKHWATEGNEIKEFYYVIKDDYKGAYPSVHKALKEIAKENQIIADVFLAKDLEQNAMTLGDDELISVVGFIPNSDLIAQVEYDILHQVISDLMNMDLPEVPEQIPVNPDFDDKIVFNGLSSNVGHFLHAGRLQGFVIKDYFEFNSDFTKEEIRSRFTSLYNDAIRHYPDSETKADQCFFYIVDKASHNRSLQVRNAVYILMSYYFEYCDIFQAPNVIS